MTLSPTTGFTTRHFINADNSFAGSYQGPDGPDNPYNGLQTVPSIPPDGRDIWNPSTQAWTPFVAPDPPIVQIQKLVESLKDRATYNFGTMAYINTCMTSSQWVLAQEALTTITPTTQDQAAYQQIQGIIQSQIGGV